MVSCWSLLRDFPDLGTDDGTLSDLRLCGSDLTPGCKGLHVPKTDSSQAVELLVGEDDPSSEADLRDQVLVFQHRGKFHAIDHVGDGIVMVFPVTSTGRGQGATNALSISCVL